MRITYICYENLSEHRGGVGHVLGVVRQLQRQSHQIRLIVPAWSGAGPTGLEGVETVPLNVGQVRIVNWVLFYVWSTLYVLFTRRPDVVYIREMAYNVFLPFAMLFVRCPLFVEVNALILDEESMVGTGSMSQRLIRWGQALTFRQAEIIVAVTRGIAENLTRMYGVSPQRMHVVANGTDPDIFKPLDMQASRTSLNISSDRPVIGFVGACYPYHDVLSLIASAPEIIQRYPHVLFLIVGDGYMRERWIQEVEKQGLTASFHFTGQVSYESVAQYMNAFTLCVAPFTRIRNEKIGLSPMKLYDYLACGRPVVGSAIEGVGDFLEQSGGGLVATPDDPHALAEKILTLLDDPERSERMGQQGREHVLANHTWAQTAAHIAELCQSRVPGR